jgi:hypothetical protein
LLSAAKLAVVGGDKSNRAARNYPTHVWRQDMANHFGVSARFIKTVHDGNIFVARCHS